MKAQTEEENCYNCAYCETSDNGVIRCSHNPKGVIKPCPYFLRSLKEKKHRQIDYRGIESLHGNVWW